MTPYVSSPKSHTITKPVAGSLIVARRRWSAEQRAEFLARFASSGKSAAQFCREAGLSQPTFSAWRRREDQTVPAAPPQFAEVRIAQAAQATPNAVSIHCPSGSTVIAVVGTDPLWLGQLAAALR